MLDLVDHAVCLQLRKPEVRTREQPGAVLKNGLACVTIKLYL